jgi:hypothetical protein
VEQDGDLIENWSGTRYHWKKIDVPQITLSNMPSVQVYVKTYFISSGSETETNPLWRDIGITFGSAVEDNGVVLYDEGCVYIFYKQAFDSTVLYALTGDYKIVVVK